MSRAQLNLYGDYTHWLVSMGVKLLTLRLDKPKYEQLQPGEAVVLRYDQLPKPQLGMVYDRQQKPLSEYTRAELLLDGYLSTKEAVSDLSRFPGYEEITADTPVLGVGFSCASHFNACVNYQHQQLLFDTPLHQAVAMSEFRGLFFPSFLRWASIKYDEACLELSAMTWHDLLVNHLEVVDADSLRQVREVDRQTQLFYQNLGRDKILEIFKYEPNNSALYQSVVLCRPISLAG